MPATVRAERDVQMPLAAGTEPLAEPLEDLDLHAAEAVDRLLGVAHDKQPPLGRQGLAHSATSRQSMASWNGSVSWHSSISSWSI